MVNSGPKTKAEFEKALDELIVRASQNGVSIDNGGYVLQHNPPDVPDMEVMFYRLAKPPSER
jgi:hypothetical protein